MANDISNFTVVGRLTRDAELKYTGSGTAVSEFSIANNWSKKVGDQWQEEVSFFNFALFGRRAEALTQYLLKGQQVAIAGSLRQERWEKDGQNRSKISFNISDIQLIGGKPQGGGGTGNTGAYQFGDAPRPSNPHRPKQDQPDNDVLNFEDDIPF